MKSIIYTSLLMLAFVGCSRYPAESEIPAELEVEAEVLMEQKELGPLAVDQLPEGLNQLSPKSVQLKEEGLYIKLWSSFVEEGGLFIPRNKTKVYNRSTDPGYWKANNETYYYIFKE